MDPTHCELSLLHLTYIHHPSHYRHLHSPITTPTIDIPTPPSPRPLYTYPLPHHHSRYKHPLWCHKPHSHPFTPLALTPPQTHIFCITLQHIKYLPASFLHLFYISHPINNTNKFLIISLTLFFISKNNPSYILHLPSNTGIVFSH